eukprot:1393287-Amorphochlora_amoeboformis.AAC.1
MAMSPKEHAYPPDHGLNDEMLALGHRYLTNRARKRRQGGDAKSVNWWTREEERVLRTSFPSRFPRGSSSGHFLRSFLRKTIGSLHARERREGAWKGKMVLFITWLPGCGRERSTDEIF